MQKNYYLCKLLCQPLKRLAHDTQNGIQIPLRCFADSVGKVIKIY